MKFFHGTSYDNFLKIKERGFDMSDTIWHCSEPGQTYLYGAIQDDCFETEQDAIEDAFLNAKFAARLAAASNGSNYNKAIILEFESDFDNEIITYDHSCEDMKYMNAFQIDNSDLNKMPYKIHEVPYYSGMRYIYLSGVINNSYFDISNLSKEEIEIIKTLKEAEVELKCSDIIHYDDCLYNKVAY